MRFSKSGKIFQHGLKTASRSTALLKTRTLQFSPKLGKTPLEAVRARNTRSRLIWPRACNLCRRNPDSQNPAPFPAYWEVRLMNQLNTQDLVRLTNGQAMTSTAVIAKGTENTHEAVIRLTRTYQADLEEFGGVRFEIQPFETAGGTQRREIALLNEQQASLLLAYMRNNEIVRSFKKRLIKAFWELVQKEAVHRDPIQVLNDPAAMRGLLLTYSEKVIELESKLNAQAPKVEALDRIAMANGAMCITDAAKTLQIRPTELFGWLHSNRWIYRRPGNAGWLAYQDKLQSQVLQHKVVTIAHSDGSERVTEQVRVTAKGLTRLSEHFSLH